MCCGYCAWTQPRHIERSSKVLLGPSQRWKSSCNRSSSPCETCAISRWADMGWHSRTNPVPLRSSFELWGRHDLTPREQRQVRTSNVLLIYAIAFATLSNIWHRQLDRAPRLGHQTCLVISPANLDHRANPPATSITKCASASSPALHVWGPHPETND